jgi:hypothetical protein
MSYYTANNVNVQALPSLSDVLPADILNSGRFSQFAPYSANPIPGKHDDAYPSAYYPSSPASSSSGYSPLDDAPSPWSHGERTPSLSPSPPPVRAELAHQHQQHVDLVWMPANMDVPGAPAAAAVAANAARASQGRTGIVTECHPKHAHGVAYIPPGATRPDVYLGHAAAAHVSKIVQLPPNQRGSLRFFRYAQA